MIADMYMVVVDSYRSQQYPASGTRTVTFKNVIVRCKRIVCVHLPFLRHIGRIFIQERHYAVSFLSAARTLSTFSFSIGLNASRRRTNTQHVIRNHYLIGSNVLIERFLLWFLGHFTADELQKTS